jgi:hypothetical protein
MKPVTWLLLAWLAIVVGAAWLALPTTAAPPPEPVAEPAAALPTVDEARQQAQLLHETMHATLQVVHHEYYREDEGLTIPAATLKKVFAELGSSRKVGLRWLVVDAQAMNVDHVAQDDFERAAVQALAAGKESHEQAAEGVYRHAGPITLTSDCLKCHLPNRNSTKPRTAGLIITIPVAAK